ncbi:tunicamycin resistance protein [Aneurinibacillus sp. REN35]|uniref:tunicamycin resistance protein n=1 Tax=Aneurinibacillus sp. REN35 TaxID=3237286 RepID=UPI0035279B1B
MLLVMCYDPENVGFFIRENLPKVIVKEDFQHYTMWREYNYSMLKYIDSEYDGTIIVPMTVVHPQYFNEIIGRLRSDGVRITHFTLCASKETLLKRLHSRGEGKHSWAAQQIERCINGLSNEIFQHHIDTENMLIEDVVEKIAAIENISLLPDNRGPLRKRWDRLTTKIKHIRFMK